MPHSSQDLISTAPPPRELHFGTVFRTSAVLSIVAVSVLFVAELCAVLIATNGEFTYSLDDPYIHLALAEQIRQGHYGIGPEVNSSPSSSALWPLLLALSPPLLQEHTPLILNAMATLASVYLLSIMFERVTSSIYVSTTLTVVTALLLNLIGVAFTGMEHSLQVLAALAVGYGLVKIGSDRPESIPRWLQLALVLGPLIRYENAAVSLAAASILFAWGYRSTSLVVTSTWVASLAAFSWFLTSLDLSPLPSSILAKSDFNGQDSALTAVLDGVATALAQPSVLVCLLALGADGLIMRRWGPLHWFVISVTGAHAVAGDFGWFGRYEIYFIAAVLPCLVELISGWRFVVHHLIPGYVAVMTVAVTLALVPLGVKTLHTPAAARDIRSQQAQTAEFVRTHWRRPIAVNDLGLVAYRGEQQVLDLWGLASQEAREARLRGESTTWPSRLLHREKVQLAAIYTAWFAPSSVQDWRYIGTLRGAPPVSSGGRRVDFYALDEHTAGTACAALERFAGEVAPPTVVVTSC
jgi:hypothetical protein